MCDVSEKTADVKTIRKLHHDGLLSDDALKASMQILRPSSNWFSWMEQKLLLLGTTLVLAGVIFFFAYNWADIGRFSKLAVIEFSIIGCVAAAYFCGLKRLGGKILLLSAAVLVGVLMAVFGQIYQTGADAYELFTGWAMLIAGWVLISEFAGLWLLFLLLLNTGAILYWGQVLYFDNLFQWPYLCLFLTFLNASSLILLELGVKRNFEWLSGKWLRNLILFFTLTPVSIALIYLIIDFRCSNKMMPSCIIAWLTAIVSGYCVYRYKIKTAGAVSIIIMNISLLVTVLIGKIIFNSPHDFEVGMYFIFSIIILIISSSAALWIKKVSSLISKESMKNE